MPPYQSAFADGDIVLPKDDDVLRDHQALQYVNGYIRVPEGFRFKGSDGLERHGDTAIAGALAWFASRRDPVEHDGYMSSRELDREPGDLGFAGDDNFRRHGGLW
jgi:phage FluMu gp28-like protein